MSTERHGDDADTGERVPYPSWTAIETEVRRSAGRTDDADAERAAKSWHNLLAEDLGGCPTVDPEREGR